ncbi:MAG: hypothetical protein ONB31_01815 [candidate division KSB1 bacterium]|nr:hypothetical protein [candidate division KSB1 bacterium]MDZ7334418.1 hypothetical protein [candidate division KSB1 bacterium]MDZ7358668.1 hypothetical protein [candidate division KSB1 bacterium]MDZ7398775.1 hypothetical protein [candidate division KSB1 bacterium]
MKFIVLIILIFLNIIFLIPTGLICQQSDSCLNLTSIRYIRLPRNLTTISGKEAIDIEDEVAMHLLEAKRQLGLYGLMVGILLDSTAASNASGSSQFELFSFDQIVGADQVIGILSVSISQENVPAEEPDYFSIKRRAGNRSEAKTPYIIQTRLSVEAEIIDVGTKEVLAPLALEGWGTGRSMAKSKRNAMKRLKDTAIQELKRLYWLSAELTGVKSDKETISLGARVGISKGMTFELIEPDRIWESEGEEWLVHGGTAAIAAVSDTAADSSSIRILRQWRELYPGAWAVEMPKQIYGLGLNFSPTALGSYINFSLGFHVAPLSRLDCGLALQMIRVADSYQEEDYGFGLGGFGIWRFIDNPKFDFGAKLTLDLDFPFKWDDDNNLVNTLLVSISFGVTAEWLISKRVDFVFLLGYRLGMRNKNWQYSEDDMEISAYWSKEPPEVKNSGMMMNVGFRYLLF